MNEGSVSLQVPRACRVIRLKLGAVSDGLTDRTQLKEKNSERLLLNPPEVKKQMKRFRFFFYGSRGKHLLITAQTRKNTNK